ncbi:hypothetical protein DI005_27120 [Prauserella sp. PE36]|uniref:DUF202 domain-containing protein n=1 Tax=Prauserella endophytica TaxID=1592324 RepID=A0ABY2RWC2_9PSEU|nr:MULTISPECIES: DUF202 domain-containing protein [Prauserella]PXY20446.1 hypothetical protein BAY59_31970 [Prauserella coralliicola]RBM15958.1 hypothetical protein DI005_27120 [Prauserella sp. PE36]TKG63138.1 DUF202 domain-containing protein [Prauserella endophytica]
MTDGLQPERTGLAWQRTSLAAGACAVLLLHAAARHGWGPLTAPAAVAGLTAAALAVLGWRRDRVLRREAEPPAAGRGLYVSVAALTAATALSSLLVFLR